MADSAGPAKGPKGLWDHRLAGPRTTGGPLFAGLCRLILSRRYARRVVRRTPPQYEAFFVPSEVDPDEAIALGVKWLREQPGEPLILLHAKLMIENNSLLEFAAQGYGLPYEAPRTIGRARWAGGSILAPWASDDVLRCIDDRLAFKTSAVCVVGWREDDPNHVAWIAARAALDLRDGHSLGKPVDEIVSDPVVRVALDHAERFVNHNNALVQAEDKAYLVRTLQELVRSGHFFDIEEIAAYAMATGWTGREVERIREYGGRVLRGQGFRLRSSIGPKPGSSRHWEAEAAEGG